MMKYVFLLALLDYLGVIIQILWRYTELFKFLSIKEVQSVYCHLCVYSFILQLHYVLVDQSRYFQEIGGGDYGSHGVCLLPAVVVAYCSFCSPCPSWVPSHLSNPCAWHCYLCSPPHPLFVWMNACIACVCACKSLFYVMVAVLPNTFGLRSRKVDCWVAHCTQHVHISKVSF